LDLIKESMSYISANIAPNAENSLPIIGVMLIGATLVVGGVGAGVVWGVGSLSPASWTTCAEFTVSDILLISVFLLLTKPESFSSSCKPFRGVTSDSCTLFFE
jgi:hypothetical protein